MPTSPTRRSFLVQAAGAAALARGAPAAPLNVLLITADDMNYSSPGAFGCRIRDITPNIDRLASQGLRFERSHVTVAVCQPSRSVLMTGRYPHRNGAEGFQPIRTDVPTLQERLHEAGYFQGILAKNSHLAPRAKFHWDVYITPDQLGQGRDPALYHRHSKEFFAAAKAARRPFFLMANSQDPHRPFAGSQQELKNFERHLPFSRKIEPSEVAVPGFLPDLPNVRKEVAEYFTSVRRCDESVGSVLRALDESGLAENTLVMFLSDNGMSFPFSKTNCYLTSTRTPWIVRWPGRTKPGAVDSRHFISGIDYTPTILEAVGLKPLEGLDGRSFLPLLGGAAQPERDHVVTVFHETSARQRYEMRCIQNGRFGYIFNAWSNGQRIFRNESQNGLSFAAMREAAASDPGIAERVKLFLYRVPEEFYDFAADPDALRNLIGEASYQPEIGRMRRRLREWMERTGDPQLEAYRAASAAAAPK